MFIALVFVTLNVLVSGHNHECAQFNDDDSKWEHVNYGGRYFRLGANMMSDNVYALS